MANEPQKHSTRVATAIILALLLLLSFAYLNSLDTLAQSYSVSKIGSRALNDSPLQQIMAISEGVPPFSLLLILLVPPFFYKYLRKPKMQDAPIIVAACIITILIIGTFAITRAGTLIVLIKTVLCGILSCVSFLSIGTFIFAILATGFRWLKEYSTKKSANTPEDTDTGSKTNEDTQRKLSSTKWFWAALGIIIIGWLPYLIAFFPGCVCYDVAFQLAQLEGLIEFNTEHPVFSTYLYGAIYYLGETIAGPNAGVFTIVLVQTLAMSTAFSLEIYVISKLGAPKWALILCALFFALVPTFGVSAQWCMKDALFSALFVVYVTLMILCSKMKENFLKSSKWMTTLMLVALFCGLLRNNGLYVIGLSLPFLCLFTTGWKARLKALTPPLLVIILIPIVTFSMNTIAGVQNSSSAGMLSVPLQQIARVVTLEDDLTDQERDFVNNALGGTDSVKESYDEDLSDGIKTLYKNNGEDSSLFEFLTAWISIGLRHPGAYLDSMTHMTYGYLSVVAFPEYENAIAFFTQPGKEAFGYSFLFSEDVRNEAAYASVALQDFPGLGILGQPGLYTWLLILEIAYMFYIGRKKDLVTLLPVLILILTILVGPVNGSIRYFLPIMAAAPIMLWNSTNLRPAK